MDNLHHGAPEFSTAAEKYEGGMLVFPSLYGMQGSVELLEQLGIGAIESRVLELTELLRANSRLRRRDVSAQRGLASLADLLARLPGTDSSSSPKNWCRKHFYSARKGYLRISAHFYNNEHDIELLAEALRLRARERAPIW